MNDYQGNTTGTGRIGEHGSGEDLELDTDDVLLIKDGPAIVWLTSLFGTWELHDISEADLTHATAPVAPSAATLKMGFPASGTIPTNVPFPEGLHFDEGLVIKRTSSASADRASLNYS